MKSLKSCVTVVLAASILQLLIACSSHNTPSGYNPSATHTPLQELIAGNQRYASGHPVHPNQDDDRRAEVAAGQHPFAIIVGCSDSRVPPEIVFDQGLGDIFVARVAGNVVDDQTMGSIEYAVTNFHVHLIVVLGHDNCGAVKAALGGTDAPGHIPSVLQAIQPAVEKAKTEPGDLLDNAINENVLHVVEQIKTSQPILAHEVETGDLQVLGARYKLAPGTVEWLTQQ